MIVQTKVCVILMLLAYVVVFTELAELGALQVTNRRNYASNDNERFYQIWSSSSSSVLIIYLFELDKASSLAAASLVGSPSLNLHRSQALQLF